MNRTARRASWILVCLLVGGVLALPGPVDGALRKPAYAVGDRWVYTLEGSMLAIPGMNDSEFGSFQFDLAGIVQVDITGFGELIRGGTTYSGVRVGSRTNGFLNGTFSVPGLGTGEVTGSFTVLASEFWEAESFLPLASESRSNYTAEISFLISTTLEVDTRLDATTSIASIPPFELEVGQNATATLDTHLEANSTVTFFGDTFATENETDVQSAWRREVIALETVTVVAGAFSSYKLNQSLVSFPGIPGGSSAGGNETAYFSNDVGYYTKRTAYENGTPVAETRLRSYVYGEARPSGLTPMDLVLFIVLPAAAVLILIALWMRRKKRRSRPPEPERSPSTGPSGGRP